MLYNANTNLIESIGGELFFTPPTIPFTTRNLWCWLDLSDESGYDSGSGIWKDRWVYGNDLYVTGSKTTITTNTGSFGGYNITFDSASYGYWPTDYNNGMATNGGACIFIQMDVQETAYVKPISIFNTDVNPILDPSNGDCAFWGGSEGVLGGDSTGYLGWPNANQYTTAKPSSTTNNDAVYINFLDPSPLNNIVWNSGPGYNIAGTKVGVNSGTNIPNYLKNNSIISDGFDWINYTLFFGRPYTMPYPFNGADGTDNTYGFQGAVKRILIYNSTLSENEVRHNWTYLNTV